MTKRISRRTVLKGLGVAVGTAALGTSYPQPTEADLPSPKTRRCYIYLEHAARNLEPEIPGGLPSQWVVSALLVHEPRIPRLLLHRTKRHRLPANALQIPKILAREASDDFREHFYKLLASPKGRGLEVYSIHASQELLRREGDKIGLVQLRIIRVVLEACHLWRFHRVFVYHNLPSLKGVSEKAFLAGLQGVRLPPWTRLRVWEHDSAWDQGSAPPGYPRVLPDEGIQATDFLAYAFYQKYQHGNHRWFNLIQPVVRRDIDAKRLLLLGQLR